MSDEAGQLLAGKRILLGICGSVAAYKAADVARDLMRHGADVHVVLTVHGRWFVTPALFEALTGHPVTIDSFDEPEPGKIAHLELPRNTDLFLVAPATAHTMAKFANGLADDMLSTALLANTSPVLLAPAMNPRMWANPATQANVEALRLRGFSFVEPAYGIMACGDEGEGRLADVSDIVSAAQQLLSHSKDMQGKRVLITAGPTREPIDPVRFLGNRSSGKMGYALAKAAKSRGASVTLISGPTALSPEAGIEVVNVETAAQMKEAVEKHFNDCDIFISAAAVSDFRPANYLEAKKKRNGSSWTVELVPNEDIVAAMSSKKKAQIVVGFAAETSDLLENASKKLRSKNLDLIAANDVTEPGSGFETDTNRLTLLYPDGRQDSLPQLPKSQAANRLLDAVLGLKAGK
ncbi:MAG: bifunctional phosphopantothenoylcysteine decarboxylase/phosphopantothenate--cysteine ligase CoaBC [bacterium]